MFIITLTTDFGLSDSYVGEMKGVLLSICGDARIVDISHEIPAQDVSHGAYVLGAASRQFPDSAIHVGVVDPGVGTDRKAIVVDTTQGVYVGPDNGLFTEVLRREGVRSVHTLVNPELFPQTVSRTFHGRDVFAVAAAHLGLGKPPGDFGDTLHDPVMLEDWVPTVTETEIVGRVVAIDRFGNAVTNVSGDLLKGKAVTSVEAGMFTVNRLSRTYGEVERGHPLSLISSQDTVELAVAQGNAAQEYWLERGTKVTVRWPSRGSG